MKIIFLGTNGWYDTKTGNTPCILINCKDYNLILDAGNGVYKVGDYLTGDKPAYLFISHFHLDHLIGLHIIFKHKIKRLKIYSQKGASDLFKTIINHPFTKPMSDWPYPPEIVEIDEGDFSIPFKMSCRRLFHTPSNLGFRFELENKTVVYSGDTGICDNDLMLSQNADVLIHECSWLKQKRIKWGHTIPEEVANLAKKAEVKQLVLTHFDASVFTTLNLRRQAEIRARKIFKNTIAASDGLTINL